MRKVGGPQRLWRACGVASTFSIGHGGVAFEAGSDTAQLCFYLSVEHLRSGRLRERGPAGRLTVAEAKCDNGLGQACGCRPGKGEQKEKRHSLCVDSPQCSVSTTLSLTPTPEHTSRIPMTQICTHTCTHTHGWASLVAQRWRVCLSMQQTWVRSLGQEDPLENKMANYSSILVWAIPWTEEPGELQSMGSREWDTT